MGREIQDLEALFQTVDFLAKEGNHELALQLTRLALEKIQLSKETQAPLADPAAERKAALEKDLTRRYLEYKAMLERRKSPYWTTFLHSLIVCGTVSIAIIFVTFFIMGQIASFLQKPIHQLTHRLQSAMELQIERLGNTAREEIPALSKKLQEEIPKISKGMTRVAEDQMIRTLDRKITARVDQKLPGIVEKRLEEMREKEKRRSSTE
jgi:hypothetical protein